MSTRYEAWDAKSDDTRDVNPADLHDLAENLIQLTAEAEGFIRAWEERAERDGWPLIPSVSDEKNAASTSIGRLTHVAGLDGDRPCGDSTETERMIRHGS